MFESQRKGAVVTRQLLYDQVWATPMARLAKEYGISDVALAKICKRLKVPYPGRGYWRRKETGKSVKQPPLTPNSDPAKQDVTIHPTIRPDSLEPVSEETTQRITAEQTPEQKIEVPDRLGKTHRLLSGQLTEWRSASVDEYGAIRSGSLRQLNIRVSPQHLSRAVRIMNALLLALEARGHQVGIQDGFKKAFGVRMNGAPVEFGLEEKFQRIERSEEKSRKQDPWGYRRFEYVSTGMLMLKITEWGADGLQKTWSDGKTAKLENCLNDFVVGLLRVAEAVKARRLKQEHEEQLRREAERRRQEEAIKRQEELARLQALEQEAANWAKAQQLRAYLSALKDMLTTKHGAIQPGSQADQWLICIAQDFI
ncbi:hypothetical protein [Nitrospira defluvii]|uniref:RWP-RK domain-containing protein n=1 Tax=Nitrospira defluvii TaxID=330214 RepID=A0ABM8S8F7_9BACT|nr:hypothetical protein [Nitrospira defluvii]CAE6794346.1 conserved hypothetical protein [Nitrospira defluvii]